MPAISEVGSTEDDSCEIDDMLDEAMDDSGSTAFTVEDEESRRTGGAASPTASAASWEFETPQQQHSRKVIECYYICDPILDLLLLLLLQRHRDFRTPLVEEMEEASPQGKLPEVEGSEGQKLMHSVSFYRKQKSATGTPLAKVARINPVVPTIAEENVRIAFRVEFLHGSLSCVISRSRTRRRPSTRRFASSKRSARSKGREWSRPARRSTSVSAKMNSRDPPRE